MSDETTRVNIVVVDDVEGRKGVDNGKRKSVDYVDFFLNVVIISMTNI